MASMGEGPVIGHSTINPLCVWDQQQKPSASSASEAEPSTTSKEVVKKAKSATKWAKRFTRPLQALQGDGSAGRISSTFASTISSTVPEGISGPLAEVGEAIPIIGTALSVINLGLLSTDLKNIVQQSQQNVKLLESIQSQITALTQKHAKLVTHYHTSHSPPDIDQKLAQIDHEISLLEESQSQILYALQQSSSRIKSDLVRASGSGAVVGGTATAKAAGAGLIIMGVGIAINLGSSLHRGGKSLFKRLMGTRKVKRQDYATRAYKSYASICMSAIKKAQTTPTKLAKIAEEHNMTEQELRELLDGEILIEEKSSLLTDLSPETLSTFSKTQRDFLKNLGINTSPAEFLSTPQDEVVKTIMAPLASTMKF